MRVVGIHHYRQRLDKKLKLPRQMESYAKGNRLIESLFMVETRAASLPQLFQEYHFFTDTLPRSRHSAEGLLKRSKGKGMLPVC